MLAHSVGMQAAVLIYMKKSCNRKQTIFRNVIQNINTLIYIKLVTYCCSNLIYLTRTLQLWKIDSERQIRALTYFLQLADFATIWNQRDLIARHQKIRCVVKFGRLGFGVKDFKMEIKKKKSTNPVFEIIAVFLMCTE